MSANHRRLPWLVIGLVIFFAVVRVATRGVPPAVLAAVAIALFVVIAWTPARRARFGLTTAHMAREVAFGVLAAVALSGVLLALAGGFWEPGIVPYLWHEIVHQPVSARLEFLAMGVTAAIGEELLFRGYLQPVAMDRLGRVTGLVLVALAFTISHPRSFAWPPVMFINLLVTGLCYGLLRGRDRPLTAVLVAHILAWVIWGGT